MSLRLALKIAIISFLVMLTSAWITSANALTPTEELGKKLFFDENLSTPPGQSCAACHDPEAGFTGPDSVINDGGAVYPGAIHTSTLGLAIANHRPPRTEARVQSYTMTKTRKPGLVVCSGMAGPPVGHLETRWPNRPRDLF